MANNPTEVQEGSAANFEIVFTNDDKVPIVPNTDTVEYSLYDDNGAIVGLIDGLALVSAIKMYISINGEHNIVANGRKLRQLRVIGEYNSANYGNNRKVAKVFNYEIVDSEGKT